MEGNIKIDLPERGCDGVDWIHVARNRNRWQTVVSTVMNLRLPQNADNFLIRWGSINFSRMPLCGFKS